jgi:hypothetical protein
MCSERQQGPASETLTGEDRRDKHESADSVMRQRSMLPTLKDSLGSILLKNSKCQLR